jgi:hypothetical protein
VTTPTAAAPTPSTFDSFMPPSYHCRAVERWVTFPAWI